MGEIWIYLQERTLPKLLMSSHSSDADRGRHHRREDDSKHRRKETGSSRGGDSRQPSDPGGRGSHHYQQQQYHQQQHQQQPKQPQQQQSSFKSGHMELNSLYSGESGQVSVNAMNAPNNSTLQCGCENIDCPFCNQMISISMSGPS